jgi:hypothetical protein
MNEGSRRVDRPATGVTPQHAAGYRRIPSLVPPSSAIPTAAEKQQYDDDDDQKGCVIHIVLLSGDDRTAGNNKCGTYFVAYRVNYVQAITSQERQGAGFVDSVATDPRPPEVGGWGRRCSPSR